jgi:hypothetical protein
MAKKVTTRPLEIIFYGMVCFDPFNNGLGYRILFPNGLTSSEGIPAHSAGLWVRDRKHQCIAKWPGLAHNNDFFLDEKRSLRIDGLIKTEFKTDIEDQLTNLSMCDGQKPFKVSAKPDAAIDMKADYGKFTAHVINKKQMIVVRWQVQAANDSPVYFCFDNDYVEVPPAASQLFLANVGNSRGMRSTDSHFRLYRRLSTEPHEPLTHHDPPTFPKPSRLHLKDPTYAYWDVRSPDIVCSPALSGVRPMS